MAQSLLVKIDSPYELLSFLRKKNDINHLGFFTRSICLSGSRNSQCSRGRGTESHCSSLWLRLLGAALGSYPGDPTIGRLEPSAHTCRTAQHCPSEPPAVWQSSRCPPPATLLPILLRGLEPLLLEQRSPPCRLLVPGSSHQHSRGPPRGPVVGLAAPRRGHGKHFLAGCCWLCHRTEFAGDQRSAARSGALSISSSAGNSGFICPRPF